MPTIPDYVNKIRTAIYGEQVRGSIADSIELLSNNFDSKDTIITGLANEIATARRSYPNLDARLGAIGDSISGLGTRLTTAETSIGTLNSELGTVKSGISGLGTRLTTAEGNISGLGTRLTTAEGNISGLDTRLTTAEDNISSLTDDFNALGLYVAEGYVCQKLSSD